MYHVSVKKKPEMRLPRNNLDLDKFLVEFHNTKLYRLTKLPNKLNCTDAKRARFAYSKYQKTSEPKL